MNKPDDRQRTTESRRILDRISDEADRSSLLSRATSGVRSHVTAKDGQAEDRIDRLGTRIGRSLALILTAAVVVGLAIFLFLGG